MSLRIRVHFHTEPKPVQPSSQAPNNARPPTYPRSTRQSEECSGIQRLLNDYSISPNELREFLGLAVERYDENHLAEPDASANTSDSSTNVPVSKPNQNPMTPTHDNHIQVRPHASTGNQARTQRAPIPEPNPSQKTATVLNEISEAQTNVSARAGGHLADAQVLESHAAHIEELMDTIEAALELFKAFERKFWAQEEKINRIEWARQADRERVRKITQTCQAIERRADRIAKSCQANKDKLGEVSMAQWMHQVEAAQAQRVYEKKVDAKLNKCRCSLL